MTPKLKQTLEFLMAKRINEDGSFVLNAIINDLYEHCDQRELVRPCISDIFDYVANAGYTPHNKLWRKDDV